MSIFGSSTPDSQSNPPNNSNPPPTSSSGFSFPQPSNSNSSSSLFNPTPAGNSINQAPLSSSSFNTSSSAFGSNNSSNNLFQGSSASSNIGLFGSAPSSNPLNLFGSSPAPSNPGNLFGSSSAPSNPGNLFGSSSTPSNPGNFFGSSSTPSNPGNFFGSNSSSPGIFGTSTSSGLFNSSASTNPGPLSNSSNFNPPSSSGIVTSGYTPPSSSGIISSSGLFGASNNSGGSSAGFGSSGSLFSSSNTAQNFGSNLNSTPNFGTSSAFCASSPSGTSTQSLFSQPNNATKPTLFSTSNTPNVPQASNNLNTSSHPSFTTGSGPFSAIPQYPNQFQFNPGYPHAPFNPIPYFASNISSSIPIFRELPTNCVRNPYKLSFTDIGNETDLTIIINYTDIFKLNSKSFEKFSGISNESKDSEINIETPFPEAFFEALFWLVYRNNEKLSNYIVSLKELLEIHASFKLLHVHNFLNVNSMLFEFARTKGFLNNISYFPAVLNKKYVDLTFINKIIEFVASGLFGNSSLLKTSLLLEWLAERDCEDEDDVKELMNSEEYRKVGKVLEKLNIIPGNIYEYPLLIARYPVCSQIISLQQVLRSFNLLKAH